MIAAPPPANEQARIAALEEYEILDTLPEQVYEDLTFLASRICRTPIAVISFVDRDRQWFKSKVGVDASETPREVAFCAHAILSPDDLLVVPDATRDERFATNPLVTVDPKIRFYAGAPINTPHGCALGALCVIDRHARELDDEQKMALLALSRQVMGQLELRKAVSQLRMRTGELEDHHEKLERYQRKLEAANDTLAERSRTDALTGLANRSAFDERLDEEMHRARRGRKAVALLLADVDHFKTFNDEFGHPAGDEVLKQLGRILRDRSRTSDLISRVGGEEFAVILPDTDLDGAAVLAERFRRVVVEASWEHRPVTLSVGVAVANEPCTREDLIHRADRALYEAKRRGRNRIVEETRVVPDGPHPV